MSDLNYAVPFLLNCPKLSVLERWFRFSLFEICLYLWLGSDWFSRRVGIVPMALNNKRLAVYFESTTPAISGAAIRLPEQEMPFARPKRS